MWAPGTGAGSPKQWMSQRAARDSRASKGDMSVGRVATPQASVLLQSTSQPPWGQAGPRVFPSDLASVDSHCGELVFNQKQTTTEPF